MAVQVVVYLASAWIVGTYILLTQGFTPFRLITYHAANAFGGVIVLSGSLYLIGWTPVLTLTVAFTLSGWMGLVLAKRSW